MPEPRRRRPHPSPQRPPQQRPAQHTSAPPPPDWLRRWRFLPSWFGLILFVFGCVLWVFPHLPAISADGFFAPHLIVPTSSALLLIGSGLLLLLVSRNTE